MSHPELISSSTLNPQVQPCKPSATQTRLTLRSNRKRCSGAPFLKIYIYMLYVYTKYIYIYTDHYSILLSYFHVSFHRSPSRPAVAVPVVDLHLVAMGAALQVPWPHKFHRARTQHEEKSSYSNFEIGNFKLGLQTIPEGSSLDVALCLC